MQGDRYSLAYFANARASTLFQGPRKLYPPINFAQILEQKNSHRKSFTKREDMTDEEYIEFQKSSAIGPEFQTVLSAVVKATV